MRHSLPELPFDKFDRLVREKGLTPYEADILVDDIELANYYEEAVKHFDNKLIVNWILRDVMGYLKDHKIGFIEFKVTPEKLARLVAMVSEGTINNRTAQEVFAEIAQTGQDPEDIVKEKGLEQVGSVEELEAIVKDLLAASPQQIADYKAGNQRLFGFFVGQAMQKTKGKGDPKVIQELLKKHLA